MEIISQLRAIRGKKVKGLILILRRKYLKISRGSMEGGDNNDVVMLIDLKRKRVDGSNDMGFTRPTKDHVAKIVAGPKNELAARLRSQAQRGH